MGGGHTNGLGGQACAQPHRHLLRCILPHDASAQLGRVDRPWRHAGRQASNQAHQPIPHHSQGLQVTHVLERYAGKLSMYLGKSEACLMDLAAGSSRSSPCTLLMRDCVCIPFANYYFHLLFASLGSAIPEWVSKLFSTWFI